MSTTEKPVRAERYELGSLREIREYLYQHQPVTEDDPDDTTATPALLIDQETGEQIEIPKSLFDVVSRAVEVLLKGGAVSIMPYHAQLTTQEAADYLGVSRPYLISLLDEDTIPYHRLRSHRRILLKDLEVFRRKRDDARRAGLAEFTRGSYERGMYDLPDEEAEQRLGE